MDSMNIANLLKKVNNINEYIAVTENLSTKCKSSKIDLNMSNVLALTKIRSLEIEHVNKCEQTGIACIIFERMLCLPPSKTWEVLSKEMVNVLQYWLDAVRKHLIGHSAYWWTFLKSLLKFIGEIQHKGGSISNILAEYLSESLLDLATIDRTDAMQRYEILHCFNLFCCESSREVRLALRRKFDEYFNKLAAYMCNCGHLPTQYSILETLLRWLVPRQDRSLRVSSATKWFPAKMYADNTVDIFLERSWMDFYQDARDFLNTHNMNGDFITSVVCTKLSVGDVIIISDKHYKDSWLDVNIITKSISVLLNPRVLDAFGDTTSYKSFETLIISYDNIHSAKFYRENHQLILYIHTISTPCIVPSQVMLGDDVISDVTAIVTSHCDHKRLDKALRKTLDDKYQLLLDLEELTVPPNTVPQLSSITTEVSRTLSDKGELRLRSGIKLRNPIAIKSPSTASTTSLAQLHERLAELPRLTFVREPKIISSNPKLSAVTEVSETDDRSTSSFQNRRFGTCIIKRNTLGSKRDWQSDNESFRRKSNCNRTYTDRDIMPITDDDATSSLLVATIGSADEAVISNKKESISKSQFFNGDNIIDLLMQEASTAQLEKERDRVTNLETNKSEFESENCDAIENSNSKVVSSTSDESNTEIISDTPNMYVTTRRKNYVTKSAISEKTLDDKLVEQFFSEHASNNEAREIISPTFARNVNQTSSEHSTDFLDNNLIITVDDNAELVDFEVLECLNNILDKVCIDLDKCTKFMYDECISEANNNTDIEDNIPLKDILNLNINSKNNQAKSKKNTPKQFKLRYKVSVKKNKTKSRGTEDKKKHKTEKKSKMSTILEDKAEIVDESNNIQQQTIKNITEAENNNTTKAMTPLLRKKRKLFSPKDENADKVVPMNLQPEETDVTGSYMNKTPKSSIICKPSIESEKKSKREIRFVRNKKVKATENTSPRSKKLNELFDKVKNSTNSEQVTVAKKTNKFEVYNFSSDSEDDFKMEKVPKRRSASIKSNTRNSDNDVIVLRHGKTLKNANSLKIKNTSKSKVNKKQKVQKKISTEIYHELVDERMREAKDVLNTSFVLDQFKTTVTEPEPIIQKASEFEVIQENNYDLNECHQKTKTVKKNKIKVINLLKSINATNKKSDFDDDRTVSPLPGLVVEEVATKCKEDEMPAKMVEKLKKICQNSEKYINESNTTHNLLSDDEKNVNSPQKLDVTDLTRTEIDIEAEFTSKSKSSRFHEAMNISKDTNDFRSKDISNAKSKSDRSISTVSINGHGDSDEVPPSPELIAQKIEPRNLDTDYLDASIRDYSNKVREEINGLITSCNESTKSNKQMVKNSNKKDNSPTSLKSPVVSIERISLDDIRRWLPSSRTSASSQSNTSKKSKIINTINEEKAKKSNKKSVHSISNEDLHEPIKKSLRSLKKSSAKVQSPKKVQHTKSIISSEASVNKLTRKKTRVQPSRTVNCTQRSIISPIKLFDELTSNVDRMSYSNLSDDEDYMAIINETSRNIKNKEQIQNSDESKDIKSIEENTRDDTTKNIVVTSSINSVSNRSKVSSSTKKENSSMKRKLGVDLGIYKRKKIDNLSVSATGSSIDDWFKRSDSGDNRDSVRDSILYVLEKIETTLVEIQQNTSQKLGQLLVSSHQRWSEINEEKHRMYKTVAEDILTNVVKVIDEKFHEMDKKSQEQDKNLLDHLKQQSLMLVKEDCKQKRVMVQLLKEDLGAVLEHERRKKH